MDPHEAVRFAARRRALWLRDQRENLAQQLTRLREAVETDDVLVSHPFDIDVLSGAAHAVLPETGFSDVLATLREHQRSVRRGQRVDIGVLGVVLESATAILEFVDDQLRHLPESAANPTPSPTRRVPTE